MPDIEAAEEWLESWTASINTRAEQAAQLASRVAALTANAESSDGSVKVTVGSAGQVEGLELDDRVRRLSGAELAQQMLMVMRRAQANLSARVAREVQATVGADSEAGRAVVHSFASRFPEVRDER